MLTLRKKLLYNVKNNCISAAGGHLIVKIKTLPIAQKKLKRLPDEEIIEHVHQGDNNALNYLIRKYRSFVWAKSRTYFLIGGDHEDIIQEGMIGLYKAIRDFDQDKLNSFKGFAELCITRQIITAIKSATRQKHMPLNSYVSLNKPIYDEESERTLLDVIGASRKFDPLELLIVQEKYIYTRLKLAELLSDLESKVLFLYLDGCTYQEMSEKLDRHEKSIDNALQRVKRKLDSLVKSKQLSF